MLAYFYLSSPFKIAAPSPIRQPASSVLPDSVEEAKVSRQTFMDSWLDSNTKAKCFIFNFYEKTIIEPIPSLH